MPVLSPSLHRNTSNGLTGSSYRYNSPSTTIERPYFSTSSTYSHPRITTFTERYTTRSYTDADGRRIFSRSGSIIENGITTRFREECNGDNDDLIRRSHSVSRDSGISSIRDNNSTLLDYPTTGTTTNRKDGRLMSTINVLDSVAELRNKYSPANYVPACIRQRNNIKINNDNNDNDNDDNSAAIMTRSKSINDIGLPPIECKQMTKLNKQVNNNSNNNNIILNDDSNLTNIDNNKNGNDDNNKMTSVADLRKKFDNKINIGNNNNKKLLSSINNDNLIISKKNEENGPLLNNYHKKQIMSRVNNFASYIPTTTTTKTTTIKDNLIKNNGDLLLENNEKKIQSKYDSDITSTSPKLTNTRSVVSPSSTNVTTNNNNIQRHSTEREQSLYERMSHHSPQQQQQKNNGLNGLKNIGNTCFMNSVIQCLSNTKLLLEYLRKDIYIKDINTNTSSMKGALIKAFAEVIKELWSDDLSDRVVNTVSLKSQIQRFAPRFIGYAQQDAQEFLRYLLEGLHEDVNRVKERPKPILTEIDEKLSDSDKASESWLRYLRMDNSRIVDYFVGQLKSTLKCTHCGHCSVTFDPFWDLSLPIPQRSGQLRLSQCLESFTREETLDGDEKPTCSKCKERRKCTKSFTIQKFPHILVIHLKRFSPTERFRGKLNVTVDFPLEGLDMSQYAADGTVPCRYNLYAVSNHSGTTYSGHYTASCCHPYNGTWHEYNDSRVSSISPKSVVSGEAYVLFYEQESKKSHL